MEDSAIVISDKYGMSCALNPSQDQRVQFGGGGDGVYDIPDPRQYQKKISRPQHANKVQDDQSVTQETIPIKMTKNKNSFQTGPFLETPISLLIRHRLDQSPQSEVQLARAIASSWDFKREEKSAGPNLVRAAAVASKFWIPPVIKTIEHEDKEDHDRLLPKRWTYKELDQGPKAKTIWGRNIPEILPLING